MKLHPAQSNRGVALVTTIIVIAIMATITVALLQTTGSDRISSRAVANNFQARLFAEAGLNAALSQLVSSAGPNMTLSLNRTDSDPARWSLQYNTLSLNGSILSSNSSLPTDIAPIPDQIQTFATATGNRSAPKFPITLTNSNNQTETVGSFSYVVIDNTAKQSLARFPTVSPRAYSNSLNEVPFITLNRTVATGLSATSNSIASLPSVATANLLFNQDLGINSQWVDTATYSPNLAPDGGPKLNLRRLKFYVDSLANAQTAGNSKAQVVEALLGQTSSINATDEWGGGGLSWLISPQNPKAYTLAEARQIAANLIDYIDDDLHPTTDDVDNPTYLGSEGRYKFDGTIQGHPYISAITFGLVFNLNPDGLINSTLLISSICLVNPWSSNINLGSYSFEADITIQGDAAGGRLSDKASSYFENEISGDFSASPILNANSGLIYPGPPGTSPHFNARLIMHNNPLIGRQPAGMTFSNISYKIENLKLIFSDTDGNSPAATQVLSNFTPIRSEPSSFTVPLTTPFFVSGRNTRAVNGLFLSGDPRLNFQTTQWVVGSITATASASTAPPESIPPVNIFQSMDAAAGDGAQGVPPNHTWYSSPNTANHFFVLSPQVLENNPDRTPFNPNNTQGGRQVAVESVAELGYLSTGRPWQTLRMVVDPANTAAGGDYALMDFIDAGTLPQTTLASAASSTNQTLTNGQVNPNTMLAPTATGLFQSVPGLSEAQARELVNDFTTKRDLSGYPFTRPGALGAYAKMASDAPTKFAREDLMRRISNLLTTQSTDFTIISRGEAINPRNNQVLSSATLETNVRVLTSNGTTTHTITSRKFD